jgi:hypothetical protein
MSTNPSAAGDPDYFTKYKNFALSRSASGVLTLRFHTDGGPHTFDGTTHHDLPRLLVHRADRLMARASRNARLAEAALDVQARRAFQAQAVSSLDDVG